MWYAPLAYGASGSEMSFQGGHGVAAFTAARMPKIGTDLIYLDESFTRQRTVVSALGVADHAWKDTYRAIRDWRSSLRRRYGIRMATEMHAAPFLGGRGSLGNQVVTKYVRSRIFRECLLLLAQMDPSSVWVINACITGPQGFKTKRLAIERITNRIQVSLTKRNRYGVMFFDAADELDIRKLIRKMGAHNPIPSMLGSWQDGPTKNIVTERILRDPVFVDSKSDYFIQMVDFVAHALLKKEEPPIPRVLKYGINEMFDLLIPVLNTRASHYDAQGIIRN